MEISVKTNWYDLKSIVVSRNVLKHLRMRRACSTSLNALLFPWVYSLCQESPSYCLRMVMFSMMVRWQIDKIWRLSRFGRYGRSTQGGWKNLVSKPLMYISSRILRGSIVHKPSLVFNYHVTAYPDVAAFQCGLDLPSKSLGLGVHVISDPTNNYFNK